MSSGGSSGGSTTTTQSGPPKEVLQAYQGLVGAASNVASQPLQQYTDPMVAGFTPQQQAGFQTIDNVQGIGFPYINAAAQQYGQATAPLWEDLPQFDTQPLASEGNAAVARNYGFWGPALDRSNYAAALAQGVSPQAAQWAGKASDWGNYGATVGGNTTQGVQGYLNPALSYANQVGSMAPGIPGQVAPYSDYGIGAANSAQRGINLPGYDTLPTYLSPYTKNVTNALQDLFNQQNAEQFQQIRGNATTQGAYGGDREAVAEAITARQQQLGQAPAFSQALQSGFAQAQNELNTQQQIEQARQQAERQNAIAAGQLGIGSGNLALSGYTGAGQLGLGASGAATGAGNLYSTTNLGAGQLGIGAGNLNLGGGNLALAGTNAGIQGSLGAGQGAIGAGNLNLAGGQQGFGEFNTQQAQKLAADQANRWLASQAGFGMASLGNQALSQALTGANAEIGAGALQQQLAQEQLNIPYQQFLQAQAYPYQQLSFLSPIVEGTGSLSGGKGSTTYPGPSALSQIGGLGAAATGLSGLFGSGSGSASGGSDFGGNYGGGFGFGDGTDAFAKTGGRIGYAKGGTTPDVPGVGNGVPILDLSYIPTETDNPVKSTWGLGIGNNNSSTSSGGGGGGGSFLSGIGSAVSAANTIGDAFGADGILEGIGALFALKHGGRAGFAIGGETADPSQSDPTKLDPSKWMLPKVPKISIDDIIPLKNNAGPAVKQGKGPPELQPMPQQMPGQPQDSGLKGIGDLGKSLKGINLFGSSDESSDSADKGYAGGGVPLSAAINFGGAPPNQSMQVDQLRQMPLERLREMAVRYPPNTQQGQIVAKVIAEKQMTPGSGAASTGAPGQAAPAGGMGAGGGYGAASAPAAGGMGGQPQDYGGTSHLAHGGEADEEPGFVTEDELDPHPIVHHDIGDTVIIEYPSEGKRIDLGLPVIKEERRHYAAGGSSHWAESIDPAFTSVSSSVTGPNGVGIPLLATRAMPTDSQHFKTAFSQGLPPGGGLGNWFQPMPQLTKFGTGPGGSTIFPSATAYTPGMAGVVSGLTSGKGTIPPEFGGSAAAPSAPSTPSPFDGIDPVVAQFFGIGGESGGKRGGRIGYADGGNPETEDEPSASGRPGYPNFYGLRYQHGAPGQPTIDLLNERFLSEESPVDRSIRTQPSYDESEKMGPHNPRVPGSEAEIGAWEDTKAGFGRDEAIREALGNLRAKRAESPVFPRPFRSDMIHWPQGSLRRGGRIGYAEGGEMGDPSEAPPRLREPDDAGMSAPMSEREQAARIEPLLRKYRAREDVSPATRDTLAAHEKLPPSQAFGPPSRRQPIVPNVDEMTVPPTRMPPKDLHLPDHGGIGDQSLTSPRSIPNLPEQEPSLATRGVLSEHEDIPIPRPWFSRALPFSALNPQDSGPVVQRPMINDVSGLTEMANPETALPPLGLREPGGGIGATAAIPPADTGIGKPAEAYRDTSRLTDIAGAPPPPIPEPFNSVITEPAAAPAKSAAAPTPPGVTRVTAPPKEAAAPATPAASVAIKPLPTDAVVNGKVWRDGKMIGPAAPRAAGEVLPSPMGEKLAGGPSPSQAAGELERAYPNDPRQGNLPPLKTSAAPAQAGKITEAQLRAQYDDAQRRFRQTEGSPDSPQSHAKQGESWEQYRGRNADMLHQDGVQTLLPDAAPNPDAKWRTQEERDAKVPPGQGSGTGGVKGLSPMMSTVADALMTSPEAKELGLTKANAAGFLGQLPVESYGGDPTAHNPTDHPNGGSRGIVQWDPNRWANGLRWAQKNGINDFETNGAAQTRFALYEVLSGTDGSGGRTLAALKAAGDDPTKSALAWLHFERPRGYQPDHPEYGLGSDQRTYNAERIFGALNGGTPFEAGASPGRSRGIPSGGGSGGGGPRQPGPGQPDEVIADKNGKPVVTPAGQTKVDDFKKNLTERTEPKDRNRLKAWMDSPSFLLFMIGAGMLASKSPFPGVALGEGLLAAGKSVQEIRKDQNREDLAEARLSSLSGRVEAGQANLAERTRHNKETEAATTQRISDAAARSQQATEISMLKAQNALAELQRKSEQGTASLDEKKREFALHQEVERLKLAQQEPIKIEGTTDAEGNPTVTLVPRNAVGDPSKYTQIRAGAKPKAGLSEHEFMDTLVKAAIGDPNYMSDPAGAMKRAKEGLAGVGIHQPGQQQQQAPPAAGPPPKPTDPAKAINDAKAQIAAHPETRGQVIQQMRAWGIDPAGL